jgi:hypothetical protein
MSRQNATNYTGTLLFPYANAAADLFKKEDVQVLALAVDQHDHTAGKGLQITTGGLANGAVTSAKLGTGLTLGGDTVIGGALSVGTNVGINGTLSVSGNAGIQGSLLTIGAAGGNQGMLGLLHPNGHVARLRGGAGGLEITNSANAAVIGAVNENGDTFFAGNLSLNSVDGTAINFGTSQMISTTAAGKAYIQTNSQLALNVAGNGYCVVLPNIANGNGQGYGNAWVTYSCVDHAMQYSLSAVPVEDPLGKVNAIQGYYYQHISFDANGNPIIDTNGAVESNPTYGFAASQVNQVIPELAAHDPDGTPSGVDLPRMVVILWEALKVLETRVAALETPVAV